MNWPESGRISPLAIRGNLDLERKKSDLAGQTLEAVSIVDLLDAIAQRGYNLYWGDIKAGRAKLNFRLWDSQLATAFDLSALKPNLWWEARSSPADGSRQAGRFLCRD